MVPLSKKALLMLNEYFSTRNERMIPFKQVAAEVRENMTIFQKIASIVNPRPIINFMKGKVEIEEDTTAL